MFEGIFVQQHIPIEEYMPYAPYPTYPSGLKESDGAIYRYAKNLTKFPNLMIIDPIYDDEGNVILPGFYGLVLSDEKDLLLLVQGEKVCAIVPVFRFEEDKSQLNKLRDKKYQKQLAKQAKKQAKIDVKRAKQGIPPEEKEIYMNASIEYNPQGDYYLIKYEREYIRAWGAIKR